MKRRSAEKALIKCAKSLKADCWAICISCYGVMFLDVIKGDLPENWADTDKIGAVKVGNKWKLVPHLEAREIHFDRLSIKNWEDQYE